MRRDGRARPDRSSCVVDGTMYGVEPATATGSILGSPESIDPGSGTTPDEYLAAVREDVGGVTLRRITGGMTGLSTRRLDDGSTVYSGTVAAGLIARETGFKEGQSIRVLPFGYVAHDEAADPAAPARRGGDRRRRRHRPRDRRGLGSRGVDVHGHVQQPRRDAGPGRARERATSQRPLAVR